MKWEILNKIAEGSFSTVYKVKRKNSEDIAALKIIHQALHNNNKRMRFKRSFFSAKKISHKNCVKLFDWIEEKDMVGFTMEYIDGDNIINLKNKSVEKNIPYMIQICDGLNEIHKNNIIHRDLKPENILLSKDNIIKITDFDLLKDKEEISSTLENVYLGTIKYSSPEQCINATAVDHRSDLYSLGIIFYELLSGELPFIGKSFTDLAMAHINKKPKAISKIKKNFPKEIEKIILKLLRKNPKDRYKSATGIIKDLSNYINLRYKEKNIYILSPEFVGRDKEIECFHNFYKNKYKTFFIEGETGVGKTALLGNFKNILKRKNYIIFDIESQKNNETLDPLTNFLNFIVRRFIDNSDINSKFNIKILNNISKILPKISENKILNNYENIQQLDHRESNFQLFESIVYILKKTILKNQEKKDKIKIVLNFDDLHNIGNQITLWLLYTIRNLTDFQIIFIGSLNKNKVNIYLNKLISLLSSQKKKQISNYISLSSLNREDSLKMISSCFNISINIDIKNKIAKLANDNPLLITEIINSFKGNLSNLKKKLEKFDFNNKSILNSLYLNKIRSLKTSFREILTITAIYNDSFSIELISKITKKNEEKIIIIFEYLKNLNFYEYLDDGIYRFLHPFIVNIVLSVVKDDETLKIHRKIARYLEKQIINLNNNFIGRSEIIEKIAVHFFYAKDLDKALKYNKLAAEYLLENNFAEASIIFYQNILKLLSSKEDKFEKIKYIIKIGDIYEAIGKWDLAENYYKEALEIEKKLDKKKFYGDIKYKLGFLLRRQGKYLIAKKVINDALIYYKKIKNNIGKNNSYSDMGIIHAKQGEYKLAEKYYNKFLKYGEDNKDFFIISRALNLLGNLNYSKRDLDEALKYYNKSLKYCEKIQDKRQISLRILNIGNIYANYGQFEKAEQYFIKSLKICSELRNKPNLALGLLNIAGIFFQKKQFNKALNSLKKSMEINTEIGNKEMVGAVASQLGNIYRDMNDIKNVFKYYNISLKIFLELEQKEEIIKVYINIGDIYFSEENYKKSLENYDNALKVSKEISNKYIEIESSLKKTESLIKLNNYEKALKILIYIKNKYNDINKYKYFLLYEITQYRINKSKENIENIIKMTLDNLSDIKKAEIFFNLFELENKIDYAKKALNLYIKKTNHTLLDKHRVEILKEFISKNSNVNEENNILLLARTLAKFMNPESAYNEFLNFMIKNKYADSAILLIINNNNTNKHKYLKDFEIKAYSSNFNKNEIELSKTIMKKVLNTIKPIIIKNAKEDNKLKNNPSIIGKAFLSVLAIPMFDSDSKIIGILYLERRNLELSFFKEEDIQIVIDIAAILGEILYKNEIEYNKRIISQVKNLDIFIGNSSKMKKIYQKINEIAKVDMNVNIYGETGTGKELIATAIHSLSKRKDKAFIKINCSSIPSELAESELFGHEKGSFTGAFQTQLGKFELANEGMLYLDEIAELPLLIQSKFLRVLENGEIWRIGGKDKINVDVRVIVSTNRNLKKEVEKGYFREDLFHRLNILKITIPPLRERKEDIPLLAYHFLKKITEKNNLIISGFTPQALEKLEMYRWAGNVRELENIIARTVAHHKGDSPIDSNEIFDSDDLSSFFTFSVEDDLKGKSLRDILNNVEEKIIKISLKKSKWNISKSSKELKISRLQLYRLIEKYKINKN